MSRVWGTEHNLEIASEGYGLEIYKGTHGFEISIVEEGDGYPSGKVYKSFYVSSNEAEHISNFIRNWLNKEMIEDPEFHKQILGDYKGAYSLGVSGHREVTLGIPWDAKLAKDVPLTVFYRGDLVRVKLDAGWTVPRPL